MAEREILRRPSTLVPAQAAPAQRAGHGMAATGPRTAALQDLASSLNQSPRVASLRATGALLNPPVAIPAQRRENPPNRTGLPDGLKAGIEALSGLALDHVRVHRNSPRPAQLRAHAFAQGGEIHLGPGQEQHLPHEAWHVVQQAQGRVRPTLQLRGALQLNDDRALEAEADRMGAAAAGGAAQMMAMPAAAGPLPGRAGSVVQCNVGFEFQMLRSEAAKQEEDDADEDDDTGFAFGPGDEAEDQAPAEGGGQAEVQVAYTAESEAWDVDLDGENIEIATNRPLADAGAVRDIVGEMAAFAARVRTGDSLSFNDIIFTISKGDNAGQPQVNFDIGVTGIAARLAGLPGAVAGTGLFDARLAEGDIKNFGWTPEKTGQQLRAIAAIPQRYAAIKNQVEEAIRDEFKKQRLGTPGQALLSHIADIFVVAASQVVQHLDSTGLTKDVPILVKTNFDKLIEAIVEDTDPAADESTAPDDQLNREERMQSAIGSVIGKFVGRVSLNAFKEVHGEPGTVEEEGNRKKRAKEGTNLLAQGGLRGGKIQPAKVDDTRALLIELRRAPVTPVADWVGFAVRTFNHVGGLLTLPEGDAEDVGESSEYETDEEL